MRRSLPSSGGWGVSGKGGEHREKEVGGLHGD